MEKILLYGLNDDRKKFLSDILIKSDFQNLVFLQENDLYFTVGYLHGLDGYQPEKSTPKNEVHDVEFMMISGFDREGINKLFDVFKRAGSPRPVTSALTDINKDWILGDLINEVYEEHLMMTGQK